MRSHLSHRARFVSALAFSLLAGAFALAQFPTFTNLFVAGAAAPLPPASREELANPASAPMQCATGCERAASRESSVCSGYMRAPERERLGIPLPMPAPTCHLELHQRYSACLVACGLPAPRPLQRFAQPLPMRRLPALGTPAALSARGPQ